MSEEENLQIVIDELNEQYYDKIGNEGRGVDCDLEPFEARLRSNSHAVLFFDQLLWSSENDDRKEVMENKGPDGDSGGGELEPLRDYLVRGANEWLDVLRKVRFS